MGIIHMKTDNRYERGTRSPVIKKLKQVYIETHKEECLKYFIHDFYNWRDMKKRFPNTKFFSPDAHKLADDIRERFGYSKGTSNSDILMHFRKLFIKLYPEQA